MCIRDRNKTVKNKTYDDKRHAESHQRPLGCGIGKFLIIEHQYNRRDTQQVKKVNGDRDTDDIGNQHKVAVAVRHISTVLPLQYEPEHKRRTERRKRINLTFNS